MDSATRVESDQVAHRQSLGSDSIQSSLPVSKSISLRSNTFLVREPSKEVASKARKKSSLKKKITDITVTPSFVSSHSNNSINKSNPDVNNPSISEAKPLTPYQRALRNLENGSWQKEITLGSRIGLYRLQKDIGRGQFSKVRSATHCLTKERVAVKIIDKSRLQPKARKMLTQEFDTMEVLHHPHIIQLFEVIETPTKIYLIMELAEGGELFYRISTGGKLPEHEAKLIFAQIVSAVSYMHHQNVVHRDLKAENVFLTLSGIAKIGDFGFSTRLQTSSDPLTTFCGSPPYAAPELFKDDNYAGTSVDVWSLGVLLYLMVTASLPFKGQTVASVKKHILNGHFTIPPQLSESCKNLIVTILQKDPLQRPNIDQIRKDDWLKGQQYAKGYNGQGFGSKVDKEVKKELRILGISDNMVEAVKEFGPRSEITGICRTLAHRVHCGSKHPTSNKTKNVTRERIVKLKKDRNGGRKSALCVLI